MKAQGATEYLVLLAVVLIVALVSVALLGFFPGMASDSQRLQSETYWRSASPIAIGEWAARYLDGVRSTAVYFKVKNAGAYPIRITGIVGADGTKITQFNAHNCGLSGWYSIANYYYLGPGEEQYFGDYWAGYGVACDRDVNIISSSTADVNIGGASSVCANSSNSPGMVALPSMGFEYIEYLDNNQQITKRQIGKQVIIKCLPPM